MKPFALFVLLLLHPVSEGKEKRVVAYFAEWGVFQRNYHIQDIPAKKLTHLIYAFAKISNGECALVDKYAAIDKAYPGDKWDKGTLRGSFHQIQILKKKHPHLKTLIAIGGWSLSGPFSDVALTPASRKRFAQSCIRFLTRYPFDGIDLDWEYPGGGGLAGNKVRPADKQNYTLLLAELRKQLDAYGKKQKKHFLLTIAAPAGPSKYRNIEISKVAKLIDWFNLMSYDFHGSWSKHTNFAGALYPSTKDPSSSNEVRKHFNVHAAVQGYLKAGAPSDSIIIGAPFFGRGWQGVAADNNGLYQSPGRGLPQGTWERGVFDFKDLKTNYFARGKIYRHSETKAPWFYDAKRKIMISFDDPKSLQAKAKYVVEHKLGGMMIWELSADDKEHSLLNAIVNVLRE